MRTIATSLRASCPEPVVEPMHELPTPRTSSRALTARRAFRCDHAGLEELRADRAEALEEVGVPWPHGHVIGLQRLAHVPRYPTDVTVPRETNPGARAAGRQHSGGREHGENSGEPAGAERNRNLGTWRARCRLRLGFHRIVT